jgi:hypothetical protein
MVVLVAVFLLGLLGWPDSAMAKNDAVAGEYIIKYKAGVDASTKSKLLDEHALEKRQVL